MTTTGDDDDAPELAPVEDEGLPFGSAPRSPGVVPSTLYPGWPGSAHPVTDATSAKRMIPSL